jgi:predicted dithiol-disulfide oxidoreductase (DUF899 family)
MTIPRIVSKEEWLVARRKLLEREKEATRVRDEVAALRRTLPMVEVAKEYTFRGPNGELSLPDLFEGRRQLIVRHFMFAPDQDEGCIGCSMQADSLGHLAHINARDTTIVLIARAPMDKIEPFKKRMGWQIPFYSSHGSDFNYDFDVTTSEDRDMPGVSVFFRHDDKVYYTYSVFDRGGEIFKNFYTYLDLTPLGRQEDQLERPWDWWRHHDKYDVDGAVPPPDNWWNSRVKFAS